MNAQRQGGVALLLALLVVALATMLVAALLDGGQLSLARTRNQLRGAQADAWARGLEAYAAKVLVADTREGSVDSNDDAWAVPLPPTPVPGGSIHATMIDLNGCFNLNNLYQDGKVQRRWVERLRRLLLVLKLSPDIADAAVDWIDPDRRPEERGAEDNAYIRRQPPYLAANHAFVDASELRLVAGVDGQAWRALRPYVCALPTATRLNLNTAPIPVLMSLADDITRQMAAKIRQDGHAHWKNVRSALDELGTVAFQVCPQPGACGLGVASEYFRARAVIDLDGIGYVYTSLLQRRAGVRVLKRNVGGA